MYHKLTPEEQTLIEESVIEAEKRGNLIVRTCADLGISTTTYYNILSRNGISPNRQKRKEK